MTHDTLTQATSFCDIVRDHAVATPDTPAFTFGDNVTSFAQLDEAGNRAARVLTDLGVSKGDRVCFLGKTHPFYFEVLLGAARIGAVMTPVKWRLAAPEDAYILGNAEARVAFVGEGFIDMLETARAEAPTVEHVIGLAAPDFAGPDYAALRDAADPAPPGVEIALEDDALQRYTSGTTGRPKGAVMTHGSILSSRDSDGGEGAQRAWQEPVEGDVTLLAMPCFHISGTGTGLTTMIGGSNAIVLPEYDPTKALDLIENYNISRIFLVPAAIQILLNHPRA